MAIADNTFVITTAADQAEARRIRDKIDSISGPGVTNTPRAVSIRQVRRGRQGGSSNAEPMLAQLTGSGGDDGFLWNQARPAGGSNGAETLAGGLSDVDFVGEDTTGGAYEVNGKLTGFDQQFVFLQFLPDPDGNLVPMFQSGGSVDILQDGTLVVAQTPLLNMGSTRATADIMEYVAENVGGTNGVSTVLKAAPSTYMGIYWDGTNWVFDWVRSHA